MEPRNSASWTLTPAQAAKVLQLSASTVRELLIAGELPGRKVGSNWRIYVPILQAWLSEYQGAPLLPTQVRIWLNEQHGTDCYATWPKAS